MKSALQHGHGQTTYHCDRVHDEDVCPARGSYTSTVPVVDETHATPVARHKSPRFLVVVCSLPHSIEKYACMMTNFT